MTHLQLVRPQSSHRYNSALHAPLTFGAGSSPLGATTLNVTPQAHLFEEVADLLTQAIQIYLLQDGLVQIEGEHIVLPSDDQRSAFIRNRMSDRLEDWTAAREFLGVLEDKFLHRKPWVSKNLTALEHYATRLGEEFREMFETLYNVEHPDIPTNLKDDESLPEGWAPEFPLFRTSQKELLALRQQDENGFREKLNAYVGHDGKLTSQFLEELQRAVALGLREAGRILGPEFATPSRYFETMTYEIRERSKGGYGQAGRLAAMERVGHNLTRQVQGELL